MTELFPFVNLSKVTPSKEFRGCHKNKHDIIIIELSHRNFNTLHIPPPSVLQHYLKDKC